LLKIVIATPMAEQAERSIGRDVSSVKPKWCQSAASLPGHAAGIRSRPCVIVRRMNPWRLKVELGPSSIRVKSNFGLLKTIKIRTPEVRN
jgi:hypothetical protein